MSKKFLWARGNNQCLTVLHKLEMTPFKMAEAQDRLFMHITCNSKGITSLTRKTDSSSSTCLSVSCLTKLKKYKSISHHYHLIYLLGPPRPSETNWRRKTPLSLAQSFLQIDVVLTLQNCISFHKH